MLYGRPEVKESRAERAPNLPHPLRLSQEEKVPASAVQGRPPSGRATALVLRASAGAMNVSPPAGTAGNPAPQLSERPTGERV
jgi:hypothetical protein